MFFCMNSYFGAAHKFEVWGTSKTRKKIIESGGGEIVFPDCADRVMHSMRKARLQWSKIEELEFGDFIEAERVRKEFQEAASSARVSEVLRIRLASFVVQLQPDAIRIGAFDANLAIGKPIEFAVFLSQP